MFEIKKILLLLALTLFNCRSSYGAEHQCDLALFDTACQIRGLNLTTDDYEIVPVTNNLRAIRKIFLHGTVPILSATGICETLPNLENFVANEVSMEEVKEYTFQGCDKVWILYLRKNNLIALEGNVFKGLSNLKELVLTSNQLFDLDIAGFLQYTPKLKEIHLGDNNLKCSRLQEILDLLKMKNIEASSFVYGALRPRDYFPDRLNGTDCLSDSEWEIELAKLSTEQQALVKKVVK